jgi:hypothetical protein
VSRRNDSTWPDPAFRNRRKNEQVFLSGQPNSFASQIRPDPIISLPCRLARDRICEQVEWSHGWGRATAARPVRSAPVPHPPWSATTRCASDSRSYNRNSRVPCWPPEYRSTSMRFMRHSKRGLGTLPPTHNRIACCKSSRAFNSSNRPVRALPARVLINASAIGSIP